MASTVEGLSLAAIRYSRVAMWFHWIIAVLIILNLFLGIFHEGFDAPVRGSMMTIHKATGLTILALSLGRLVWRLGHRPPAFDPVLRRWEVVVARAAHWIFYFLMIAIPLTGWSLVSTGKRPVTSFFGLFNVPPIPVPAASHETWEELHGLLGYAILVLLILHVAGAIKHHVQGHRHLIGRMVPWLYRQR